MQSLWRKTSVGRLEAAEDLHQANDLEDVGERTLDRVGTRSRQPGNERRALRIDGQLESDLERDRASCTLYGVIAARFGRMLRTPSRIMDCPLAGVTVIAE